MSFEERGVVEWPEMGWDEGQAGDIRERGRDDHNGIGKKAVLVKR